MSKNEQLQMAQGEIYKEMSVLSVITESLTTLIKHIRDNETGLALAGCADILKDRQSAMRLAYSELADGNIKR